METIVSFVFWYFATSAVLGLMVLAFAEFPVKREVVAAEIVLKMAIVMVLSIWFGIYNFGLVV